MFRFRKDDRYTAIAIYAFLVLAATILTVVVGMNLSLIWDKISSLLSAMTFLFVGVAVAYVCNPIVRFSEKVLMPHLKQRSRRFTRILALVLTYLTVAAILCILALMIVPQIVTNYQDFADNVAYYISLLFSNLDDWLHRIPFLTSQRDLSSLIHAESISDFLISLLMTFSRQIGAWSANVFTALGHAIVGFILSAYILYYKDTITAKCKKILLALFPRRFYRAVADILHFADRAFGRFILGRTLEALLVGLITFVTLAILQMPYYPLVSGIICITNIIPIFGPLIGGIPSFLIIFIKDPIMALWFVVFMIVLQQIDGNFIGPRIVGSTTGLSAVWVITAIMLAGAYFGPLGWFIGVPLFTVVYRVIGDLANSRLAKKRLPTDLTYYETHKIAHVTATQEGGQDAPPTAAEQEEESEGQV